MMADDVTLLSEGELIWFLNQAVTTRVAKVTLGMETLPDFDPNNEGHRKCRSHLESGRE